MIVDFFKRCPTRIEGIVGLAFLGLVSWWVADATAREVAEAAFGRIEEKVDRILNIATELSERSVTQNNHQNVNIPPSPEELREQTIRDGMNNILKQKGLVE